MPANASEESAAKPPGPVMCTDSPAGPSSVMVRISSTAVPRASQPPLPASMGTSTWRARLSSDGIGPTGSRCTPSMSANCFICAATAAMSPLVAPLVRS